MKALGTVWLGFSVIFCKFSVIFSYLHFMLTFALTLALPMVTDGSSNFKLSSVFNTIQHKRGLQCSQIPHEVLPIILMGWACLGHGSSLVPISEAGDEMH